MNQLFKFIFISFDYYKFQNAGIMILFMQMVGYYPDGSTLREKDSITAIEPLNNERCKIDSNC